GLKPADPSIRRLPLLVWGDVFPNGGRPQVRRALAGSDAHEGMYTWVYFNELLTVRDMLAATMPTGATAMERFEALRAVVPDPQRQITEELPGVFLPVAELLMKAGGGEFVEIGSTMFASIEKLQLCARLIGQPLPQVLYSGIEYSPFLRRAALSLHPSENIKLVVEPHEWQRSEGLSVHVSRFVGSYAFRSTETFAAELARCDAFHIIDVFDTEREFHSWDLGLPITFFDVKKLKAALPGFEIYVTKATPEYHYAGRRKAMVLRLLGAKPGLVDPARYTPLNADTIGKQINNSLTAEEWEAFADYKKHFPVWGGPTGMTKREVAEFVRPTNFDLHFDDAQASAIVRNTPWL
ncbi:MAG: hypothetical protein JWQ58_2116, partial [Reyranella sp.]|nr:hypothetical protein [Reyranella sp.]